MFYDDTNLTMKKKELNKAFALFFDKAFFEIRVLEKDIS